MMNVTRIADSLAGSLPSREDIIHAVGLATRRSPAADVASVLGVFGAGMLVGAGLTLLFAPQSGAELRRELGARLSAMRENPPRALRSAAPGSYAAAQPG